MKTIKNFYNRVLKLINCRGCPSAEYRNPNKKMGYDSKRYISYDSTIIAINISTALKCHNSPNFYRRDDFFSSKFASSKNLSNETKLVPVSLFV